MQKLQALPESGIAPSDSGRFIEIAEKDFMVVDSDAIKAVESLRKKFNFVGTDHILDLIDKYRPDGNEKGIIKEKSELINALPNEFRKTAEEIFFKYQKEQDSLNALLNYENRVDILLSGFSGSEAAKKAVSELRKIEDCRIKIAGAIRYDEFVKTAMRETPSPYTLLDTALDSADSIFKLSLDRNSQGSRTAAAEDTRKVIETLINGTEQDIDEVLSNTL